MCTRPLLTFNSESGHPEFGSVSVRNLDPRLVTSLRDHARADRLLRSVLWVAVIQRDGRHADNLPDVIGRYQLLDDAIHFAPYFPFERGIRYRASFDPWNIDNSNRSEALTLEFSLPKPQHAALAEVKRVFPSSESLPENLLRFYACFSTPMQRGRVRDQIVLLGPDGKPVADSLYRAPVELWDKSMRFLTILLDPGRIKRGLGPNVELGPPLKAGHEYTLEIGAGMIDASDRPLREAFRKRFVVMPPVREWVAIDHWKIETPLKESRQPVVVTFPRPLDRAMLAHAINIVTEDGLLVDGCIAIDCFEKRWSFTPTTCWSAGSYQVHVNSGLEDICGNSLAGPFDRNLLSSGDAADRPIERSRAFSVV